jgi:hypothetical protein
VTVTDGSAVTELKVDFGQKKSNSTVPQKDKIPKISNSAMTISNYGEFQIPLDLTLTGDGEGWETDPVLLLRNHVGFSWSYQNCLGLLLVFLVLSDLLRPTWQLIGRRRLWSKEIYGRSPGNFF